MYFTAKSRCKSYITSLKAVIACKSLILLELIEFCILFFMIKYGTDNIGTEIAATCQNKGKFQKSVFVCVCVGGGGGGVGGRGRCYTFNL